MSEKVERGRQRQSKRRKAARFFPSSYIRKELKENDRREGRESVGKRRAVTRDAVEMQAMLPVP